MEIIGIEKLEKIYSKQQVVELHDAFVEWINTDKIEIRIPSTVLSGVFKSVSVRVTQHHNESDSYLTRYELERKLEEIFKNYLYGVMLHIDAIAYKPVIVDIVTSKWIEQRMLKKGVRIKDIAIDTGIDKSNLSTWISGLRPMSQPVKAMFYFYLTRPTDRSDIVSAFFEDISNVSIGDSIKILTDYLSEIDVRPHIIKKSNELNCQVSIDDFSKEVAEIKFIEKRFITS